MSQYTVYVSPSAWREVRDLPGNTRHRIRRAIDSLTVEPRPIQSKRLDAPSVGAELRRLRLDRWRIVYAVSDNERIVDVLAVRKRPPYDYSDLERLLSVNR